MEQLLIQAISGAVGGNIAGGVAKNQSLGTTGNSIAGLVGGLGGGALLGSLMGGGAAEATSGIGPIISQVASGGFGGAVVMLVVGMVKNMMAK